MYTFTGILTVEELRHARLKSPAILRAIHERLATSCLILIAFTIALSEFILNHKSISLIAIATVTGIYLVQQVMWYLQIRKVDETNLIESTICIGDSSLNLKSDSDEVPIKWENIFPPIETEKGLIFVGIDGVLLCFLPNRILTQGLKAEILEYVQH